MNEEVIKSAVEEMQKPEEMKKCQYCGKSFRWFEPNFAEKRIRIQVPTCNCIEEREKAAEAAKAAQLKKEKLERLFKNSLMTPLFQEKTFEELLKPENLAKYKNEEDILKCKYYAETFDTKTSSVIQMVGKVGTAKTTLLAAICNHLLNKGFSCLFTTLSDLLDKFSKYSYENSGDVTPLLKWLVEFDFIVLDDIGRETYTDKRKETSFRIVDTLLNYKKCIAYTANPEMIAKLKKIPEWNATLDRMKGLCKMKFVFKGESLRGQDA